MKKLIVFFAAFMLCSLIGKAQLSVEKCSCSKVWKPEFKCENVIDGDPNSIWNSGGYAPQWVKLTLDVPHTISKINWINEISPNGEVAMEFKFYNEDGELVSTVNKVFDCESGQVNTATFSGLNKVKVVKVTVVKSPSWIAMREISLY